jgi:hypothetical protein
MATNAHLCSLQWHHKMAAVNDVEWRGLVCIIVTKIAGAGGPLNGLTTLFIL